MTTAPNSGSSPSRPESARRPRSPRALAFALALWLAVVGNAALWRELVRIRGGVAAAAVDATGTFVLVAAALTALTVLVAWGRWAKPARGGGHKRDAPMTGALQTAGSAATGALDRPPR